MTSQEQQLIDELVERIRNTPVVDKDGEAERHLQQTLGTVPDALYVLTQTVLVQQYGLNQAQAQLRAKQDEIDALKQSSSARTGGGGGSFLSRIFGSDEEKAAPQPPETAGANAGYRPVNIAPPPGQTAYPPPPATQGYGGPAYGSYGAPGYGNPAYGGPGYGGNFGGGGFGGGFGGGGFMRGALQTAAGVAAGALVFRGMEDLFQGFGGQHHEFSSSPGESVVNNYYGDGGEAREGSRDDSGFYNADRDASRDDLSANAGDTDSGERGFGAFGGGDDAADTSDDSLAANADLGGDNFDDGFGDDGGSFDDSGDDNSF